MKPYHSTGNDDHYDNIEPLSSGIDTGVHRGELNGQGDIRHLTLREIPSLIGYNIEYVLPNPQPSLRVPVVLRGRGRPCPMVMFTFRVT